MLEKLLITGAAGMLGKVARSQLKSIAKSFRLTDIAPLEPASEGEECIQADLGDKIAVNALMKGCDGVLHFGGISTERPFNLILNANIVGTTNLYEAVLEEGGKARIIFASSNHAIGFYEQSQVIDASVYPRPDTYYGVSKVYGEAIANMFHDKFGIETAIIRIGSSFPEPKDHRMLKTWMSFTDLMALVTAIYQAPKIGCPIIYGVSDNETVLWDNSATKFLNWQPKDNTKPFKQAIHEKMPVPPPSDASMRFHGGSYCSAPLPKYWDNNT